MDVLTEIIRLLDQAPASPTPRRISRIKVNRILYSSDSSLAYELASVTTETSSNFFMRKSTQHHTTSLALKVYKTAKTCTSMLLISQHSNLSDMFKLKPTVFTMVLDSS